MNHHLFCTGRCLMTAGVDNLKPSPSSVLAILARHTTGDWGDVCAEDAKENDFAVNNEQRILSVYTLNEVQVWVVTEWDRSVTTILLPSEY